MINNTWGNGAEAVASTGGELDISGVVLRVHGIGGVERVLRCEARLQRGALRFHPPRVPVPHTHTAPGT